MGVNDFPYIDKVEIRSQLTTSTCKIAMIELVVQRTITSTANAYYCIITYMSSFIFCQLTVCAVSSSIFGVVKETRWKTFTRSLTRISDWRSRISPTIAILFQGTRLKTRLKVRYHFMNNEWSNYRGGSRPWASRNGRSMLVTRSPPTDLFVDSL